jgi:hypothetical protein
MTTFYKTNSDGKIIQAATDENIARAADLILTTEEEVVTGYDGGLYLASRIPTEPAEAIAGKARAKRAAAYALEADPIKFDYEESLARGTADADTLKSAWLAKKDEIRDRFQT